MRIALAILLAMTFALSACGSGQGSSPQATIDTSAFQVGYFSVDSVSVEVSHAEPPEVTLQVEGVLPDACTSISQVLQDRTEASVVVTLTTIRPRDAECQPESRHHHETVRLGAFDQPGSYSLQVNSFSSSFEIGGGEPAAGSLYDAPLSIRLETSDGALSIQAPVGWAVEASSGLLRIAATEGALYDTGIPSAARISFTIVTGPARAQDFGLDGHTPREVFGYFALYPESRVGPPSELSGLPWPGMEGHSSGAQQGDQHLIELATDADTNVVVQAYCPAGDWDRFEPMLRAVLGTLQVK